MKLGLDISQIVYRGTGVGRFTSGLLDTIIQSDIDNSWTFFFSSFRQKIPEELKKKIEVNHELIRWYLPPTVLSYLWNDLHDTKLLTFNSEISTNLDWFITSDWTEPPLETKKATIVHDLVFKRYPQTVHKKILKTQEKRLELVAKESRLIFADSHATAADLKQFYNIPEDRIIVNYPGVSVIRIEPDQNILKKYGIEGDFILTVGKLEPRKNIKRLIDAYQAIIQDPKPKLVIIGPDGWDTNFQNDENVKFIGYVTDHELASFYQLAQFFVYPSLYEGFGYPIIEAMQYGCPVATSSTSSLKEIAEGYAEVFDPENTDEIKDVLTKMMNDKTFRQKNVDSAKIYSSKYTWKSYYDKLVTSLKMEV